MPEKTLQQRLDQAEARYDALVKRLPVVIYTAALDVQAAFTYLSPQVEDLLGYKPEEFISDRALWLKLMPPEDRRRILAALGKAHAGGKRFSAEYRLLHRSGRAAWISDESEVVRDKNGRPLMIQGMWTDITRGKTLAEEAESLRRELASSRSELEQFISIASHELRAPLRRIANLGELLTLRRGDSYAEEERGLLTRIRDSAAAAQELVAGLVAYGETEQRAPLSTVDMNEAAGRVLAGLSERIRAEEATITCRPLPKVLAVPSLLERVLYHLLDNALKFRGTDPPRIHIWAARSEGLWTISVRDNGAGIPHRRARRIFSAGVGMGTAICRKIVERFGGRIWVDSEPGEGSTFHFTLRATPEEAA